METKQDDDAIVIDGRLQNILCNLSRCKIDFINESDECKKLREANSRLELELREVRELEKSHRYHLVTSREMIANLQDTISQLVYLKRDVKKLKEEIFYKQTNLVEMEKDKETTQQKLNENIIKLRAAYEKQIEELKADNKREIQQIQHDCDAQVAQFTCVIEELRAKIREMEAENRDKISVVVLEYEEKLQRESAQVSQLQEKLARETSRTDLNIDAYRRIMSRKYQRTTLRASWSADDLDKAMRMVLSKEMGVNEASRTFNIPSRTLRRHILSGKSKGPLGRKPVFSLEHEKKLVAHIKKLEKVGFAPDRKDVKEMAFRLAKNLNIKNPFSESSESAGNVWFSGFMARNSELSQRRSEGLSLARAYGVNRNDVQEFFDLLSKIYEENDFANHPEDIFNMDESGIQVNNKPGKVIATKGAKDVYTLTSCEKGENVTVIACCNAQGNFLPPVLIYKGTYNKPQFSEGLPPGSQVFMNKKSSYINTDLFMQWFEEIFLRHKSPRKTLLILDGHSSHSNNIRLLEVAKENNVILLCLPSHTTHALQPLDRAFFRPLKVYFSQEAKSWMVRNKDKKLTRYDVSKLIGRAWGKAATISNGVSALKCCGIYPFNPSAIPDHYFSLSDSLRAQNLIVEDEDATSRESISLLQEYSDNAITSFETILSSPQLVRTDIETENLVSPHITEFQSEPGPSGLHLQRPGSEDINLMAIVPERSSPVRAILVAEEFDQTNFNINWPTLPEKHLDLNCIESESALTVAKSSSIDLIEQTPEKQTGLTGSEETPSKLLNNIYPVPKLPVALCKRKQKAVILTSAENIENRRKIADKKKTAAEKSKKTKASKRMKTMKSKDDKRKKKEREGEKTRKCPARNSKKKKVTFSSTSESNDENENRAVASEDEVSDEQNDSNRCVECTEDYYQTKSTEDWIQCMSCLSWLHEFCTMYYPMCNRCGRKAKREAFIKNRV